MIKPNEYCNWDFRYLNIILESRQLVFGFPSVHLHHSGGIDHLEQKQVLRKGIDRILESNGIDCFFVESHWSNKESQKVFKKRNTFTKLLGCPFLSSTQWGSTAQPTFVSSLGIGSKISACPRCCILRTGLVCRYWIPRVEIS